jgi:hypothetical protein
MPKTTSSLFTRIETEIDNYLSKSIELSPGVNFSQYTLINRIYKFTNHDQSGEKINSDLSYNYWFDVISPRVDSEVKNLRFDTKNILLFSNNPRKDFAAVFVSNASLKNWLSENGEDLKLKTAVERFSANGNVGFKKIDGGYEIVDDLNTFITNTKAESVDDTDIIERHEMLASQMKRMKAWDQEKVDYVIKELGNKSFSATPESTEISTTGKRYEIYEFTGEVSEKEYNKAIGVKEEGDENDYFLAKIVVAGLQKNKTGEKYVLFSEKLKGKISDWYNYAHRGRYNGRFWRVGMYELLFDHQLRANEIGNGLARGLEWSSKVVFKTSDGSVMQNIRADIENGDIVQAKDLSQLEVRMQGVDQLIADWNRLMSDADRLANSYDVVRGEAMPSQTPFRMGMLMDQNAGKLFVLLRQKITLPYKRVFREWVLPELWKDMKGKDVFRFTGETDIQEQLNEIIVDSWYVDNLVKIGPHTKEVGDAIKQEKLDEMKKADPVLKNAKEIWDGIHSRVFVTITGENSDVADQMQDLMTFVQLEQDPERVNWILDTMYKARGIPIPPKKEQPAPELLQNPQPGQQGQPAQTQRPRQPAPGQEMMQ